VAQLKELWMKSSSPPKNALKPSGRAYCYFGDLGDELETLGANSVTALAEVTPAYKCRRRKARSRLASAGGVGPPNVENSVAMYVDGVYIASPSASLLSLNMSRRLKRSRVHRGRCSGATPPAARCSSRRVSYRNLSGKFDVSYGNYQSTTVNGYVADGLTPAVAADFAMHVAHQGEGYGKNLFTGSDVYQANLDLALRSKWVLKPTEADAIHLIFDFERRDGSTATVDYIPAGLILPLSSFRQSLPRCRVLITSTHLSIPRIT